MANEITIGGRKNCMKAGHSRMMKLQVSLTAEEHLQVQREIERRAHELWHAGGCRQTASLNDWLQAEREIMEKFLQTRFGKRPIYRKQEKCGSQETAGTAPRPSQDFPVSFTRCERRI
jgi:post-segregation antitoxin (ccd killing protein)